MRGGPTRWSARHSMDLLFPILLCLFLALAWWPWCCCGPTCLPCSGGVPDHFQVVIADLTPSWMATCTAGQCTSLEDTYVLDYHSTDGDHCYWVYRLDPHICVYKSLWLMANFDGTPPKTSLNDILSQTEDYHPGDLQWSAALFATAGIDCRTVAAEPANCVQADTECGGGFGSTATITAL